MHKESPISKRISKMLNKEAGKFNNKMMPIHQENGVYNFYLKVGDKGSIAPLEEKKLEDFTKEELLKLVRELQQSGPGNSRQPKA